MPRLSAPIPKYRLHRASGQAIVSLSGKDWYLGPYGTKASHREYDRVIAEWLARDRQGIASSNAGLTLVEVCVAYKRFAEGYYHKNGVITNEVTQIVAALQVAHRFYGREAAESFGPLKLEALQQAMIARDWSRNHINKQIGRIVRAFSWAARKQMVPPSLVEALREVPYLGEGRSGARETAPVRPVDDAVVKQTLPFLPPMIADMVRVQRLTACRPEEICRMRPCDVERTGDVWIYRPETHKTEHQDQLQVIFIGPRAQSILAPYLGRQLTEYCFCFGGDACGPDGFRLKDFSRSDLFTMLGKAGDRLAAHDASLKPFPFFHVTDRRRFDGAFCIDVRMRHVSGLRKVRGQRRRFRPSRSRHEEWREAWTWLPTCGIPTGLS